MAKKRSESPKKGARQRKAAPATPAGGGVRPVERDGAAPATTVAPKPTPPAGSARGKPGEAKPKAQGPRPRRASGLSAAAGVLAAARKPMHCREIVEAMLSKGLWKTAGKTPAATINAAMLREIKAKGKESRFRKAGRGLFAAA